MKYLTAQDILVLHDRVIEETGGSHGLRDLGLLIAAAERPKMAFGGTELYRDTPAKAAAYFESLARNHPFVDGNKRTAVLTVGRFLYLNGLELAATNRAIEHFALRVAKGELNVLAIAAWLKRRLHRIRK